jgi:nitrate/TMAO reductase-like tetraheme cytochrome c subunit
MRWRRWLAILAPVAVGAIVGAVAIVGSIEVNRHTSTDAFCASCHTMANLAVDPKFKQSAHRNNAAGVTPSCGACHIPATNWFVETYTHVTKGIKDVVAQSMHDYSDAAAWEARRIELAHFVRDEMRTQDSVTCRSCHDAQAIRPASARGQAAHALLRESRMTCIDCHFNLVHAPVPPSLEFIRGSAISGAKK